jgi:hypothetical protein
MTSRTRETGRTILHFRQERHIWYCLDISKAVWDMLQWMISIGTGLTIDDLNVFN